MKPRLRIARATVDDLPWLRYLIDLFRHDPTQANAYPVFDDEELDHFTLACLRALQQNPKFAVFVAWHGKKAIGCLGGEVSERLVGKPHLYANALWAYVQAPYRKGDAGFRLVEAWAEWAAEQGCTMMECKASPGDTRYADQGYPLTATCYAAPIRQVLDQWRGHAYPLPATPQVEQKEAATG